MARRIPPERFHEIVQAATAVFLEQGYQRTQMGDVAERAGLAKGTLYLYFESKEALFDAALERADAPEPAPLPRALPLPTPRPGETLAKIRARVTSAAALQELGESIRRRRVRDVRAEVAAIVRELYAVLARHRVGIKLLDRCAREHPELAAVWFESGRLGVVALLRRYLEDRIRRESLPALPDVGVTARMVLELVAFWAVHRHWDPAPETFDEGRTEATLVEFVTRALLGG